MSCTLEVLKEVRDERHRQDEKWGGAEHDDRHNSDDWMSFIREHSEAADIEQATGNITGFREELIHVAALCVAAIEAVDRMRIHLEEEFKQRVGTDSPADSV